MDIRQVRIQRSRLIEMDIHDVMIVVLVILCFLAGLWIGTILDVKGGQR